MGSVLVRFPRTCPCFGTALGCSSLPMPWWAPALQPSGLCCLLGVTISPRALDHKWNSSFTCARWQRASSAQMLFGQRRVTEVVNHITAVSLSSKHSHKFLNCVFCTGNYRQTAHRAPVSAAGLRLWATSSQCLALSSGTMLCSGAKQEYLFLHHHFQRYSCPSIGYFPPFIAHWRALGP